MNLYLDSDADREELEVSRDAVTVVHAPPDEKLFSHQSFVHRVAGMLGSARRNRRAGYGDFAPPAPINAIFSATGRRVRRLPVSSQLRNV
jgi:hypothetical protein